MVEREPRRWAGDSAGAGGREAGHNGQRVETELCQFLSRATMLLKVARKGNHKRAS